MASSTWTGAGANANWSTKENWVGNVAPATTGVDIIFNSSSTACLTNDNDRCTNVNSITLTSPPDHVFITNSVGIGTLTVTAGISVTGTKGFFFQNSARTLKLAGNQTFSHTATTGPQFTVSSAFDTDGYNLSITTAYSNSMNFAKGISGSGNITVDSGIGTVTLNGTSSGTGTITVKNSRTFNAGSGGATTVAQNITVESGGISTIGFNPSGTTVSGNINNSGTMTFSTYLSSVTGTVTNSGTLSVISTTINLSNTVTNTGTISLKSTGITLTKSSGTVLSSSGTLNLYFDVGANGTMTPYLVALNAGTANLTFSGKVNLVKNTVNTANLPYYSKSFLTYTGALTDNGFLSLLCSDGTTITGAAGVETKYSYSVDTSTAGVIKGNFLRRNECQPVISPGCDF